MTLSENIRYLRTKTGVSLKATADGAGLSKTCVQQIEGGVKHNPSLDTIRKLADFFEVGIADLIENTLTEESSLTAMYRTLKTLSPDDLEIVGLLIKNLQKNAKAKQARLASTQRQVDKLCRQIRRADA